MRSAASRTCRTRTASKWRLGIGAALVAASVALTIAALAAQVPSSISATPANDQAATGCFVRGGTGTLADTANHANCKATQGNFYGFRAVNTTATIAYLRLYNLATDPNCASATGFVETIPLAALATGYATVSWDVLAIAYPTGIGYCVTGGGTSTDNTAPPAGVYVTIRYR